MEWYMFTLTPLDNPEIDRIQQRLYGLYKRGQEVENSGGPTDGAALFSSREGNNVTLYFTEPAVLLLGEELANHSLDPCDTPDLGPEETTGSDGVLIFEAGDRSVWNEIIPF